MRILLKIVGGILIVLVLALIVLRITGLNPNERRPGLWLTGTLVTTPVTDWSFTDKIVTVHLQAHTAYLLPHSVTIWCASMNGHLYLGSSNPPVRHWDTEVEADPHARLGIGDKMYDVTLVPVTDQTEWAAVMAIRQKKYPAYKQPKNTKFILFRVEQ